MGRRGRRRTIHAADLPDAEIPAHQGARLEMTVLYASEEGRKAYRSRGVTVEPLFQRIKDAFGISAMPVRGLAGCRYVAMACVLVYRLAVYRNCVMGVDNPRRIKHMLGS